MKDGSVRRGQKGLSGRRKVCPSTAGQPPLSRGTERLEARGSRGPARQTASLPLRGGRPRAGRDPGRGSSRRGSPRREDWGRGGAAAAAEAPRHLAGVPATRAGTRSAGRVDRTRSYPGTLGVRAGGKLTLRRLGSRCSSALRPSPGWVAPRRSHLRGGSTAPRGRGGGGGRLARRLRERPGGPGLGPPQSLPLVASGLNSGCARRGRKLSDLASSSRHSDSD